MIEDTIQTLKILESKGLSRKDALSILIIEKLNEIVERLK